MYNKYTNNVFECTNVISVHSRRAVCSGKKTYCIAIFFFCLFWALGGGCFLRTPRCQGSVGLTRPEWCKRWTLSIKTSPLLQTTKTPDGLPRNRHWHNYQGSPPLCADRSRSAVTRSNRHPVLRRRTGDERTANARKGYRGPRGRRRWHSIGLPLAPSLAGSTACIYLNQQG